MNFEIVDFSVLKIYKTPIHQLSSLAEHYYLSESNGLDNSISWGPEGLELQGVVKVTSGEIERISGFVAASNYSIATHNCEHFCNYVLHGINFSSQQHSEWKNIAARVLSFVQPVQSIQENQSKIIG